MKKSVTTIMIAMTTVALVFIIGIFVGQRTGASVPISNVSHLIPTEFVLPENFDSNLVTDGKVNINKADLATLVLLPGIGDKTGRKILAYRDEHGPFRHIDELLEIEDFGETRLNNIAKYITVGD